MKRYLPLLLLLFCRVAPAQVDPAPAAQFVRQYAGHYRVSPELLAALIDVESRWNPRALSSKGAMGLMQLMPATARRYGAFKPFDEEQNIAAGRNTVCSRYELHRPLPRTSWQACLILQFVKGSQASQRLGSLMPVLLLRR